MTQATPGPWKMIPAHISEGDAEVRHPDGWLICTTPSDDLATLIVRAVNDRPELIAALERAIDLIGDWGAYASNYFQEKHGLDGDIADLRAILEKAKAQ